jgi:hypothetical protein
MYFSYQYLEDAEDSLQTVFGKDEKKFTANSPCAYRNEQLCLLVKFLN